MVSKNAMQVVEAERRKESINFNQPATRNNTTTLNIEVGERNWYKNQREIVFIM